MRRQLGLRFVVIFAGAAAVVALAAAPALSDPAARVRPRPADVVGVGSGTSEYLLDQLAASYDAAHKSGPHIYSYDAPASASMPAGPRITPKSGCRPIARPDGSSAGIAALENNVRDGGHFCLDFVRAVTGPAPGVPADVSFVPLALDDVTYASITRGSHAPKDLSTVWLHAIYTCKLTRWTQVGGTSSAVIRPLLPQPGSGTAAAFLAAINVPVPGACVDRPATLAENEGVSSIFTGKNAPDEIIPFSAGRWLAQAYRSPACAARGCPAGPTGVFIRCKKPARGQNAFGCDVNGRLKLNHINGRAPVTGTGARAVLGASFPSAFVRTLYDVVRGTGTIPSYLKPFFGPKGAFCGSRYRSVITSYGFAPALGCGMPPWIIRTVAGAGPHGYNGDGIPASRAELTLPTGAAMDGAGNLVIADLGNSRIRVVAASTGTFYGQAMTAGDIYTIAGNGDGVYNGDGIPATTAGLRPAAVAVDHAGNLVVTDDNDRIRVVAAKSGTFYGQAMTAGDIYTVAGDGHSGYNGDGIRATSATLFPQAVAVDGAGNLVIADLGSNRVRVVAASTGTFYGQAMTAGDIYTIAGNGDGAFNGNGIPATSAGVNPEGVAMDSAGNLVIADGNALVRVVAARTGSFYGQAMTAGDIYTVAGDGTRGYAGDGGPALSAALADPHDVAMDHDGNLVISDTFNNRVRVAAVRSGTFYGIAMTKGDIYTVGGDGPSGWNGDGIPATTAQFSSPLGVAVSRAGDLLICDAISNRVRVISSP